MFDDEVNYPSLWFDELIYDEVPMDQSLSAEKLQERGKE